jgi:hypothetical protein
MSRIGFAKERCDDRGIAERRIVAHRLGPQAVRWRTERGCRLEGLQAWLARGVGIVQLPCPEQQAWGGVSSGLASLDQQTVKTQGMNRLITHSAVAGPGLFTQLLQAELSQRALNVAMTAHDLIAALEGKPSSMVFAVFFTTIAVASNALLGLIEGLAGFSASSLDGLAGRRAPRAGLPALQSGRRGVAVSPASLLAIGLWALAPQWAFALAALLSLLALLFFSALKPAVSMPFVGADAR